MFGRYLMRMDIVVSFHFVFNCSHFFPSFSVYKQIRLYVLQGNNLTGQDHDNLSDPYLEIKLGTCSMLFVVFSGNMGRLKILRALSVRIYYTSVFV